MAGSGISKMATIWQNTDFNVSTFDYQWTIQNALPVIQSTVVQTPPFKAPVQVKINGTVYTPMCAFKLATDKSGVGNPVWCKKCSREYSADYVHFGMIVTGGLDQLKENANTNIWVSADISVLRPDDEDESTLKGYLPGAGYWHPVNQNRAVQLRYKCHEYNKYFLKIADLSLCLIDDSLTLYVKVTAYILEDPKQNFVNEMPVLQHLPLNQPDFDLGSSMNAARERGTCTDVILVAGSKEFRAHKAVLAAQSSFFKTRFEQRWERDDNKVEMSDVTPETLEAILTFLYTGQTQATDMDQILRAAEEYELCGLKEQCEKAIAHSLSNDNVIDKLLHAEHHKAEKVKQACLMYILRNPSPVSKTEGWEKLKSSEEHTRLYTEVLEHLSSLII